MKEQLEYLFIRIIIAGLKKETLPLHDAKQLAHEFLSIEPFSSPEDAHSKMDQFIAKYPQFTILKEYADAFYDEDKIEEKISNMKQLISQNNIDEALNVAKS